MKKIVLCCVTLLLAVTVVFSFTSCGISMDRVEDLLNEWAEDGKIVFVKAGGEFKYGGKGFNDLVTMINREYDVNVSLREGIEEAYLAIEDEKSYFLVLEFEEEEDAQVVQNLYNQARNDEYGAETIEEMDLTVVVEGEVAFVGTKSLIYNFLEEL